MSKQRTMAWLQAVETKTLQELEVPQSRWDDLDTALAEAVDKVASGPLRRDFTL